MLNSCDKFLDILSNRNENYELEKNSLFFIVFFLGGGGMGVITVLL